MPRFLPMRCELAAHTRDIGAKGTKLLKNEVRGFVCHGRVFSTIALTFAIKVMVFRIAKGSGTISGIHTSKYALPVANTNWCCAAQNKAPSSAR